MNPIQPKNCSCSIIICKQTEFDWIGSSFKFEVRELTDGKRLLLFFLIYSALIIVENYPNEIENSRGQ